MNLETKRLEEQLEAATAQGRELDPTLDAETRALREGWLALGKRIEAAPPGIDETFTLRWRGDRARRRRRWAAFATALSLAVAAAAWSLAVRPSPCPFKTGSRADAIQTRSENASPKTAAANKLVETELEWEDSLDEEIAAIGHKIWSLRQEPYRLSAIDSPLAWRLKEMEKEMADSTL